MTSKFPIASAMVFLIVIFFLLTVSSQALTDNLPPVIAFGNNPSGSAIFFTPDDLSPPQNYNSITTLSITIPFPKPLILHESALGWIKLILSLDYLRDQSLTEQLNPCAAVQGVWAFQGFDGIIPQATTPINFSFMSTTSTSSSCSGPLYVQIPTTHPIRDLDGQGGHLQFNIENFYVTPDPSQYLASQRLQVRVLDISSPSQSYLSDIDQNPSNPLRMVPATKNVAVKAITTTLSSPTTVAFTIILEALGGHFSSFDRVLRIALYHPTLTPTDAVSVTFIPDGRYTSMGLSSGDCGDAGRACFATLGLIPNPNVTLRQPSPTIQITFQLEGQAINPGKDSSGTNALLSGRNEIEFYIDYEYSPAMNPPIHLHTTLAITVVDSPLQGAPIIKATQTIGVQLAHFIYEPTTPISFISVPSGQTLRLTIYMSAMDGSSPGGAGIIFKSCKIDNLPTISYQNQIPGIATYDIPNPTTSTGSLSCEFYTHSTLGSSYLRPLRIIQQVLGTNLYKTTLFGSYVPASISGNPQLLFNQGTDTLNIITLLDQPKPVQDPQNFKIRIQLPEICTWSRGSRLELAFKDVLTGQQFSSSTRQVFEPSFIFPSSPQSKMWTCSGIDFVVACTLLYSHPCGSDVINKRVQSDALAWDDDHLTWFDLNLTLSPQSSLDFPTPVAIQLSHSIHYLDLSTGSESTFNFFRGIVLIPPSIIPNRLCTTTSTSLYPAHTAYRPIVYNGLPLSDVSIRIQNGQFCTINQGFVNPTPAQTSMTMVNPIFILWNQTIPNLYNIGVLLDRITPSHDFTLLDNIIWPAGAGSTSSFPLYKYSYDNLATTSPSDANKSVDNSKIASTIFTPPGPDYSSLCSDLQTHSCVLQIPSSHTDHFPTPLPTDTTYPDLPQSFEITFLKATLAVGLPSTRDLRLGPDSEIVKSYMDMTDRFDFNFGYAPVLYNPDLLPKLGRDKVRIIIRSNKEFSHVQIKSAYLVSAPSDAVYKREQDTVTTQVQNQLQCVWSLAVLDGNDNYVYRDEQLATVPISTTGIKTYTYPGEWHTNGGGSGNDFGLPENLLGLYTLPTFLNTPNSPYTKSNLLESIKLSCFTGLPQPLPVGIGFSIEIQDPSGILPVPFGQRFTIDPPLSPNIGAALKFDYSPIGGIGGSIDVVNMPVDAGFQKWEQIHYTTTFTSLNPFFRFGDSILIWADDIPPWLMSTVINSSHCSLFNSKTGQQIPSVLVQVRTVLYVKGSIPSALTNSLESSISIQDVAYSDTSPTTIKETSGNQIKCTMKWTKAEQTIISNSDKDYTFYPQLTVHWRSGLHSFESSSSSFYSDKTSTFDLPPYMAPSNKLVCDAGFFGDDCLSTQVPIQPTVPTTSLPAPPPRLPQTTADPTQHCQVVVDVNGQYKIFTAAHTKMCSIPTAGTLTTRSLSLSSPVLSDEIKLHFQNSGTTNINICDCHCKGYWFDEPTTVDNKKCSKCSIPDGGCPTLMTPNADCTACECSTPLCKKMSTYLFTTLYFKPQMLRWLSNPSETTTPAVLNAVVSPGDLQSYLYSPSDIIKAKYSTTLKSFSSWLSNYYTTQIDSTATTPPVTSTTKLTSITTAPLLEGSFTAWMFTLGVVNNHQQQVPIQQFPNFGMAQFPKSLSTLFVKWLYSVNGPLGAANADGLSTDLGKALLELVSTPPPTASSSSSSPSSSPSFVPLYSTNTMTTKCISYQDHVKSTTGSLTITVDLLHPCPASNQYIPVTDTTISPDEITKRLAHLNPLWSPCTDTQYTQYETLLQSQPATTTISTRQIYPQCFDFTGTNLSNKGVPCQYQTQDSFLYSTERVALLNPTYITTVLSSFSPDDIAPDAQPLINSLRSQQLTKFPHFPLSTTIMCTLPTAPPDPVIALNSLTATPTTLTIDAHSHMSWTYQGDDTQHVTLVMKSTQKENDGTGQFVFSQVLGTASLSNLFSTPQIPTYTNSPLFTAIYDMYHASLASPSSTTDPDVDNNNTFGQVYNVNTGITILGYLNQNADLTFSLDMKESATAFNFVLPMMCDQLRVTCAHADLQFCYQADGRCRCKPGYRSETATDVGDGDDDDLIEYPYETNPDIPNALIDGNQLICVPMCDNNGEWDQTSNECKCLTGTTGQYCQYRTQCEHSSTCNNHGYLLPSSSSSDNGSDSDTCGSTCICSGSWVDIQESPFVGFIDPKEGQSESTQCNFCPLSPYHSDYYSQTELDHIQEWHNADPTTRGTYTPDQEGKQTYISEDSQQQHCYITGTDHDAMKTQCPTKCICRKGYGGDYCQLHVAYATFPYTKVTGVDYDYDETSKSLLFSKFLEEIALSMLRFDKTDMFIFDHDRDAQTITVGFYSGLDFFFRNQELSNQNLESQSFFTTLSNSLFSAQQIQFGLPSSLPTNLDSLYTQWGQLQATFPQTPISNQDSNKFLGEIQPPLDIQDPSCYEHSILGCSGEPPAKRASGKGLLIGLIVGLVGAALLFIILVVVLLWCKKNKRGLWKSKEEQDRDEMSNFVPTTRKQFNGSTNAPSMTVGTLSIMPVLATSGDGVEMSHTTASASAPQSSVQSVNNHTEITDPSLPSNYKGYKDAKGQVFYVNSETMTTTWHHPNKKPEETNGATYGSGW